jgi:zinc/manganese transport system permease protein
LSLTDAFALFGWQFVTGLVLALFVPLVGLLLRLRDEWLAALGLTHIAAAGGVAGAVLGWPALAAALAAGGAGALVKWRMRQPGNTIFAAMMLAGWAAVLLISANDMHAHLLGQALIDGQLYFTGPGHLAAVLVLAAAGAPLLAWLAPRLMREALFPGHQSGNEAPVRHWHLAFDLLAVATVAVAALALGIMAAFALALLPAWVAFGIARTMRTAAWIAAGVGLCAYCAAFAGALAFDQPFGPMLVAVLLASATLRLLRHVATPAESG